MDTAKIKTLRQVNEAIAEVDAARNKAKTDRTLSQDQKDSLDDTSVLLRQLLNDILLADEQAFINALNEDATALNDLITKITQAAASLAAVANLLQKLSAAVGGLVTMATAGIAHGLL